MDRPGRLTLVEGAGGLLVEIGDGGVTLRDLAVDLAAPVLVVARAGLGTLNHAALTLEALASQNVRCAGLVIGSWPREPGGRRDGQPRSAFGDGAAAGRVAGRRGIAFEPAQFASMSSAAFDPQLGREPGRLSMVHSVELLFDSETEAAVRRIWDDLTNAGVRSQAAQQSPSNRPHVTLAVAEHMDDAVNDALRPLLGRLPLACTIGAPMLFGRGPFTLVRLVVPSAELLALQAEVHEVCLPHMSPGPLPHADPGHWTPHVTLARRVDRGQAGRCAVAAPDVARSAGSGRRASALGRQQPRGVRDLSVVSLMVSVPRHRRLASMSEPDPRTELLNWSDLGVSELPTGTVTLLLADVEGSTRLWEAGPDAMADAVARLDRCLTDLVSSHHGVRPVEQGEGDSFVVAFARASDAVACALKLQRAPLAPIRLRIGLHTGEVRLRDEGNYIGPTINRTARLRDLAHGGQTVLSGVTEELVFEQLPAGAWLTDLGTHALRDVARPERVTQLCHPDVSQRVPAAASRQCDCVAATARAVHQFRRSQR